MNTNSTSKWFVDAVLFAGFVVAFFLDLTGLELHQWIGLAAGGLAAYHLLTHWTWVNTLTQRFLKKTSGRARLYYLFDAAIFAGFFAIGFTGLVISSWLNLSLSQYDLWLHVHIQASIATLVLTVIKIGLHGRWVVSTAKKIFSTPPRLMQEVPALRAVPAMNPAPVPVAAPRGASQQMNRRDFLKMMGVVGAASVLALGSAASALNEVSARQTSETGDSTASAAGLDGSQSGLNSSQSSSGLACTVSCGRQCSYPGHCRRYTDSNGNGRCDLGECI